MERHKSSRCATSNVVNALAKLITNEGKSLEWKLAYPASVTQVTDYVVIEKSLPKSNRNVFLCIERDPIDYESQVNQNYVNVSIGTGFNPSGIDLRDASARKYAWPIDHYSNFYTRSPIARLYWTNSSLSFTSWVKVDIDFYFGKGYFQLALKTLDAGNGQSYTSVMYVGEMDLFTTCDGAVLNSDEVNYAGNFGFFVTGEDNSMVQTFGGNTSNAVTSVCLIESMSGAPMQAYDFAFNTHDEFADKNIEGPGKWTDAYNVSKIYLFNKNEGYMGWLRGAFSINLGGVVPGRDKQLLDSKRNVVATYGVHKINSAFSPFSNSPNVLSGIAFLKEGDSYVEVETVKQTDFTEWVYCSNFKFHGALTNETDQSPSVGFTVKMYNSEHEKSDVTESDGKYELNGLPYGTYTLEVYDSYDCLLHTEQVTIVEKDTEYNIELSYSWIDFNVMSITDIVGSSPTFMVMLHPANIAVSAFIQPIPGLSITRNRSTNEYTINNVVNEYSTNIVATYGEMTAKLPLTILDPQSSNQYLPPIDIDGSILVLKIWDYGDIDLDTVRISRNGEVVADELVAVEEPYTLYIRELKMGENEIKFEGLRSQSGDVSICFYAYDYRNNELTNYMTDTNKFIACIPVEQQGVQSEPYPAIAWKVTRRR